MSAAPPDLSIGERLQAEVLAPMKLTFVGKDEIVDLLGLCLVAGENLFLLGPPGTAKSALVQELGRRLEGRTFEYLLTRFSEPSELFGPFDIRRLREGELVTNTEGMLPEASLVFLDELLNANSAVLNSLLTVLNERVFRRGRETRRLPLMMTVGASNHLPDDDALGALFDRFLMRVRCDNVPGEQLREVLAAGWRFDTRAEAAPPTLSLADVQRLQGCLPRVDLEPCRPALVALVQRLRHAGFAVSDRRAVKLQRLIAASALLCGRLRAAGSDLWVLRYIWDVEEQADLLQGLVQEYLADETEPPAHVHPRARDPEAPDPEALARDLEQLRDRWRRHGASAAERSYLRDRLALFLERCEWVLDHEQRQWLLEAGRTFGEELEAPA